MTLESRREYKIAITPISTTDIVIEITDIAHATLTFFSSATRLSSISLASFHPIPEPGHGGRTAVNVQL
jgi:hypothetical protein